MSNLQIKEPNYSNWISMKMLYVFAVFGVFFIILSYMYMILSVGAFLSFLGFSYFAYARFRFSPRGGDLQAKIRELTINQLYWDGKGKALDIGCGNAPLTLTLAKKFPDAQVIGIDYWSGKWDYSKKVCEENAELVGVAGRVNFQKASAAKLPFETGYFDAVISNLVFHEVHDAKDKRDVIKEALRVVRKGGKFSFQDLFLEKKLYGSVDDLVKDIGSWGVDDIQFIVTNNSGFIPTPLKLPFMVGKIGILCGTK